MLPSITPEMLDAVEQEEMMQAAEDAQVRRGHTRLALRNSGLSVPPTTDGIYTPDGEYHPILKCGMRFGNEAPFA